MQAISLKFPPDLDQLVEAEAKRRHTSKSAVIRTCVEEVLVKRLKDNRQISCADLAGPLIGSVDGPSDASTNKKYLEEAILEDVRRERKRHR
jgi:hypothetical protein